VDLGHHLPYARVSFGLEALETRRPDARDVAAILSIKDYPDTTRAGLVDAMLRVPAPMVLTQTFAPADRQVARERIDLAIRRLTSADADALAERAQMSAARDALGLGQAGFGDHHLSVMVRADTLAELETACSALRHALSETGAIAVREDVNLEPAFWAQFPGNEAYAVRRAMISSTNAAGFLSLHGFAPDRPMATIGAMPSLFWKRPAPPHATSVSTRAIWVISPSSDPAAAARRWCSIS
jgi:type IV secretion system protein VirB4